MKRRKAYKLPIGSLKEGINTFEFELDSAFVLSFENAPIDNCNTFAKATCVTHLGGVDLQIEISGTIQTQCDRCLEEFDLPIEGLYDFRIKKQSDAQGMDDEDPDLFYVEPLQQELNIDQVLYEYLILSIPSRKVHEDAGLECDSSVLDFLDREVEKQFEKKQANNPFASLKDKFKEQ